MNTELTAQQEAAAQLLLERRRERTRALRACTVKERLFLRQLPKSRYAPYTAGEAIGISGRSTWKFINRPHVKRAMALFLEDALDEIGVSHASLMADLVHVKELCIKHLLTEPKAAAGAIAAIGKLMELANLSPAKRIELTTKDGKELPAPVFNISFAEGGPGDYGIEVSGAPGSDIPGSDVLN